MIQLITFANQTMSRSAELCMESSLKHGADYAEMRTDLDVSAYWPEFTLERQGQRGCGYFMWKPFVILQCMTIIPDGNFVVYSDAGIEFINNIRYLTDRMDQDVFLFGNMWEHAHWCKRDIIDAIMPEAPWEVFGKQVQASVMVFRVSEYTKRFVSEWLEWCVFEDGRLIDDSPSKGNHAEFQENRWDQAILTTLGYREGVNLHYWPASYCDGAATYPRDYLDIKTNHPEFKENRHDQAILTTMAYRDRLGLHKWPARYNLGTPDQFDYEQGHYADDYPTLFNHHRKRNDEW